MAMANGFHNKIRMTIKESLKGVHHGLSRRGANQGEGRHHHWTPHMTTIHLRHQTREHH